MATPSDTQVRANIASIITDALDDLYGSVTIPRVHGHWILSLNLGESAASVRALSGDTKGKVHAWMIATESVFRERPDIKDGFNTQSLQKMGPSRRNVVKTYRVWAFRQLETGTEVSNSENNLLSEIEHVSDFIDKSPTLGFTDNSVRGHLGLNFKLIDTFSFGDTLVNIAQGQLSVVFHRHIVA